MKTKLLFYSAVVFLFLWLYVEDGVLYSFFAIHLLALAIGVFFHKREDKLQQKS